MVERRRREIPLNRNIAPIEGETAKVVLSDRGGGRLVTITLPIIRTGRDPSAIVPTIRIEL